MSGALPAWVAGGELPELFIKPEFQSVRCRRLCPIIGQRQCPRLWWTGSRYAIMPLRVQDLLKDTDIRTDWPKRQIHEWQSRLRTNTALGSVRSIMCGSRVWRAVRPYKISRIRRTGPSGDGWGVGSGMQSQMVARAIPSSRVLRVRRTGPSGDGWRVGPGCVFAQCVVPVWSLSVRRSSPRQPLVRRRMPTAASRLAPLGCVSPAVRGAGAFALP